MRGLQDGSRTCRRYNVWKTRGATGDGSWRISDTAFDLCLQIDDGIANRLRAANQDIAFSGFVEQLRCVGHRPRDQIGIATVAHTTPVCPADGPRTIHCQTATVVSQPAPSADPYNPLKPLRRPGQRPSPLLTLHCPKSKYT